MVGASWKVTRNSIVINCFRHTRFETPPAEAALGSKSPQHDHEECASSSCQQLRQLDEVAADLGFEDFFLLRCRRKRAHNRGLRWRRDSPARYGTAEESDDVDDMEDAEAPVPNVSQVMDTVNLLRQLAREPRTH